MDVEARADGVASRDDLVRFLADLAAEVQAGRHPADNASAVDLLESASAWTADMDGYYANRGEEVPATASWALIAHIFAASLVYE